MTTADTGFVERGSSRWQGGYQQEAPQWCFAATEQTMRASFGIEVRPQEQCAYELIKTLIEFQDFNNPDVQTDIEAFRDELAALAEPLDLPPLPAYDEIKDRLGSGLKDALRLVAGSPNLDPLNPQTGGVLTAEQIIATIDADGLVAFGNARHWRVAFGYSRGPDGAVWLWVFDPLVGDTSTLAYTSLSGEMEFTYRCA